VIEAFYERTEEGFLPTEFVTGPWDPRMSHAGPPAALLINEIDAAIDAMAITRASFDIPRGIPKVPYRVRVDIVRPGRKIQQVDAAIVDSEGVELMTASASCIRVADEHLPISDPITLDLPAPEACESFDFPMDVGIGYMDGVEMRRAEGRPFRQGPAAIWIRQTIPLIHGESADPMTLCGLFGDLGNGISAIAPFDELLAINTDLTLSIARPPESEWIGMRSTTVTSGLGLGMTDSVVYDAVGFVARANQSIFFDRL
jgi:hypothetical protein